MRAVTVFSYTLAFALKLKKSAENLSQDKAVKRETDSSCSEY
jgi:hypothetical protein